MSALHRHQPRFLNPKRALVSWLLVVAVLVSSTGMVARAPWMLLLAQVPQIEASTSAPDQDCPADENHHHERPHHDEAHEQTDHSSHQSSHQHQKHCPFCLGVSFGAGVFFAPHMAGLEARFVGRALVKTKVWVVAEHAGHVAARAPPESLA